MFAVYRVFKNGKHKYVPRSVTPNKRLAEDIAASLSRGEVITPWGATRKVKAYPHIVKPVEG